MHTSEKLDRCLACVRRRVDFQPAVALVLGSGLGDYGDSICVEQALDYRDIEGFPVSTVPGHKGRFLFGRAGGVPVVVMQGRVHYYEGYAMPDVVLPIRLMGLLGTKVLFLTNAAGAVNTAFRAGEFMLLRDQISDFVPSPLTGPNLDALGPRFPDMSEVYDRDLAGVLRRESARLHIPLREGTYLQFPGPNFETPAEVRMARLLGADAVGMSTACEAVAARHMGMRVCGVSFLSNLACGMAETPLSHEEVQQAADRAAPLFTQLVTAGIRAIGREVLRL